MKPCMQQWKEEYLELNNKYYNHVTKFVDYLKIPTVNKVNSPALITLSDLESCVAYYIERGSIRSEDSFYSHLESVKDFYHHLVKKGYVEQSIIPYANYSDFKTHIVDKYNLKERIEREWLGIDDIKMILDRLDAYFYETTYSNLRSNQERERYIYRLCLNLYIKLSLIAPAKKSTLLQLTFNDFSNDFREVIINEIRVKIPNGLRHDILYAVGFANDYLKRVHTHEDLFFFYVRSFLQPNNFDGTFLNVKFSSFLKSNQLLDSSNEKRSFPIDIVANTTIYNMVIAGVNPYYISQLSGITISQLENKYYDKIKSLSRNTDIHMELNENIAKCEYYTYI